MAHDVKLQWAASSDQVSGYNIYRGAAAGQETTLLNATPVTTLTYDDTVESAGVSFYVVKSVLNGVESIASNEISVTLRPAPPTNLVVVSAS